MSSLGTTGAQAGRPDPDDERHEATPGKLFSNRATWLAVSASQAVSGARRNSAGGFAGRPFCQSKFATPLWPS